MRRLFDEHIKRPVQFLDGAWRYCVDIDNKGEVENWTNGLENYKTTIIPSVWNNEFGLFDYEGVVWYEKDFYFNGETGRIVFEAVMTECKVWLDGNYLGYHYGGFCQFDFIVPNLTTGIHKLVVKVSNKFDETSIPQRTVDWYNYGGITRSVSVESLYGVAITYGKFDYTLSSDLKSTEVFFTAELYGAGKKKETEFSISLNGNPIYTQTVSLKKGSIKTIVTDKIKINNIELWDISKPKLYDLCFSTDTDDLIDKIGFRKIEVKNQQLLLNGKSIELRGVNRHEDYPDFGMAMPSQLMKKDLDIIENLGCNTMRGSHYPNAKIFVDMLDERGILFWSEIPIWGGGFSDKALADERVVNRGLLMHKEMVKYYYNHPSIILWGMHNEINTGCNAAYEMSKLYYNYLKQNGGNRLVTYASDKPKIDTCFEFCDIISLNRYYGWYYGTRDSWSDFMEEFDARRKELKVDNKPVIMSEFGGDALYGQRTFEDIKWSEEYQAEMLSKSIEVFHNCPYIVGFYVWQFCDSRSDKDPAKVKAYNNKGILNEHRQPKMAYFVVKEKYHKFK